MIKGIKRRFILISMLAIGLALSVLDALIVVGGRIIINYNTDRVINVLVENGGQFNNNSMAPGSNISEETPFETRFFTVEYLSDDKVIVHTENIKAISSNVAREMADNVISKRKDKGTLYKFRYVISYSENSTLVIFVDTSRYELIYMLTSILSFIATLCIFGFVTIFILIFSKAVAKPIEENFAKQKGFITNAAHELKTPLTVISANNELVEMEYGESDSTIAINKQILKMNKMVKNMTSLASLDEKMGIDLKIPNSLSDILIETVDSFKDIFELNGLECNVKIEGNLNLNGDEKLIKQLCYILVENANKYAKSFVNISLCRENNKTYLEISNDSLNIPNGNLDKYFERFYRSDEARASEKEGSGIGLSIAKEIVNLHKGEIHAFGANNVFTIKIAFK